jgi:hypothetical protein
VEEKKLVKVAKDDGSTTIYKEVSVEATDKSSNHFMTNDEESLSGKAERAANAISDLVDASVEKAGEKVRRKVEGMIKSGALEPGHFAARKDSDAIGRLGSEKVTQLATVFEDTMTVIRERPYEEQERLLIGYRKLLEEQINVIDSRIQFAKRIR